jgi:RHS repeat-associated protein
MNRARIGFGVLLFSTLLMDCGRMLQFDDLDSDESAVVDANTALVATQAPNGAAIGDTPAAFTVTDDGQASYSIPIWTPKGPMGVEPSLAFEYNSNAGSGPLGVGWRLSGMPISRITRCNKTVAVDTNAAPIDYAGDTYCLDGKRLINIGGSDYRTEEDEFSKITRGAGFESGSTSFTVWRKDGLVLRYGWNNSSRLIGRVKPTTCRDSSNNCGHQTFAATGAGDKTLAWAVDQVKDKVLSIPGAVSNSIGNYMNISYTTFSEAGPTNRYNSSTGQDFSFKEMLISEISYGFGAALGNETPTRRVIFTWGGTGGLRSDVRYNFVSGLPIQEKRLLKQIDVQGPKPTGVTIGLLRQYKLNYESALPSNRSRLQSVQECDGAGICRAPTKFKWENGTNRYKEIIIDAMTRNVHPYQPFTVMDTNADGKDDLLVRYAADANGHSPFAIYESKIAHDRSFVGSPIDEYTTSLAGSAGNSVWGAQAVDIDRDGRSDMMLPSNPGIWESGDQWIRADDQNGNTAKTPHRFPVTRFDLVRNHGNLFYRIADPWPLLQPATGSTPPTGAGERPRGEPTPYPENPYFVDLDGDGRLDVVQHGAGIGAQYTPPHAFLLFRRNTSNGLTPVLSPRAKVEQTGQRFIHAFRTKKHQITANGQYVGLLSYDGYATHVADIDGSGRQAFIARDSWLDSGGSLVTTGELRAFNLTSSQTTPLQTKLTTLPAYSSGTNGFHYIMIDANGDGLTDAVQVENMSEVLVNGAPRVTGQAEAGTIGLHLNTGAGFKVYSAAQAAYPGTPYGIPTRQDAGLQVADMNQDGVPDLWLLGRTYNVATFQWDRTEVQMLLGSTDTSNNHLTRGDAGRTPITCNADGLCIKIPAAAPVTESSHFPPGQPDGAIPAALGDFNGDGLVDIAMVPWPEVGFSVSKIHFYINEGKKADQITSIDTGLDTSGDGVPDGAHIGITYAPISDPAVYRRARRSVASVPGEGGGQEPWEQPAECRYPRTCIGGGMWVVKQYETKGDNLTPSAHKFFYTEGRTDALRGWLGFAEKYETDVTTGQLTATTFDNITQTASGHYPYAFLPAKVGVIVRDSGVAPGSNNPHRWVTNNTYEMTFPTVSSKVIAVRTKTTEFTETLRDPTPASVPLENLVFLDDNNYDVLKNELTTYVTHDAYNNVTFQRTTTPTGHINETTFGISNHDTTTNKWVIGRLDSTLEVSTTPSGAQSRRSKSYTYWPGTKLLNTETTEPTGGNDVKLLVTYKRDTAGKLGQVTQKTMAATRTADDIRTTSLNRVESYDYDTAGGVYLASFTNAANQKTLYAYHPGLGVLAQEEDPNGLKKTYQYDGFGQLRKQTDPAAGDITITHEVAPSGTNVPAAVRSMLSAANPRYAIRTVQVGGGESLVTYNHNGRQLMSQKKAGDNAFRYVYARYTNIPGQVSDVTYPFRISDAGPLGTIYSYDTLGRQTNVLTPDLNSVQYRYGPRNGSHGYLTTTIDQKGLRHEQEKDDRGRVVAVTDYPGGTAATTLYDYGPFDRLKSVAPPNVVSSGGSKGAMQTMTYDVLGRRVQLNDPDSGIHLTSYNAFGDIIKETDAMGSGAAISYWCDNLGRVVEKRQATEGTTTYTWDTATGKGIGKLNTSSRPDGTTPTTVTYVYDTLGRPQTKTWSIKGRSYQVGYQYETTTSKRLLQVDYPTTVGTNKLSVQYGYDAAGDISSVLRVSPALTYWRAHRYDAAGRVDQEDDGSGMRTTRIYNANRGWIDSILTKHPTSGVTIQHHTYKHDPNGNINERKDFDSDNPGSTPVATESFIYNEMDMMRTASFNNSSGGSWMTSYTPGPAGPITQGKLGPGVTSLNYDYWGSATPALPHAVRSINGTALEYDAKGRTTLTQGTMAMTYTSFDLPKTITAGSMNTTFTYDADHRRVSKDYAINGFLGTDHWVTTYAGGLYERRTDPTQPVSHVMYIKNGSRVVAQETWTESGTSVTKAAALYLHGDVVGSITATNTAATLATTTRLRYDSYGARIHRTDLSQPAPDTIPTHLGFTGHEMDDEFGFINMKGRIYDASIARFLTADPLVSAPYQSNSYDRYGYGLNNPLKYTDPSGFMMMVPFSDQWLAQQGYGDSASFFHYARETFGAEQSRRLDAIRSGTMTFSMDGKNYVILGGTHESRIAIWKAMQQRSMTAQYAGMKQERSKSMLADRYIGQGAAGGKLVSPGHGSIAVDTYKMADDGTYIKTGVATFDFGLDYEAGLANFVKGLLWKGKGRITESEGLNMVAPYTVWSSPESDIALLQDLRHQALAPPSYNIGAFNCWVWSWANLRHSHVLRDWDW